MHSAIKSIPISALLTIVTAFPADAQSTGYLIQIDVTGNSLQRIILDSAKGNTPLTAKRVGDKMQITIPASQVKDYQDATLTLDFASQTRHILYLRLPLDQNSLQISYVNYDIKSCLRNEYKDIYPPSRIFEYNLKTYMKARQIYKSDYCISPANRKYFAELWFDRAYKVAISRNGYAMDMDAYDALVAEAPKRKAYADGMIKNIGELRYAQAYSEMQTALKEGQLEQAAELNGRLPALLEKGNLTGAALSKEQAKLASNQAYIATLQKAQ